ncbi:hypothetical protein [Streptomyces alanosinicus]|uniref:hypothetical protein n=1 Tax=Streptomyces alanosinicus TaxID=68171 RepID=UPI001674E3E1|nr:hypothetical protein [Streptomyces alanosinicus]
MDQPAVVSPAPSRTLIRVIDHIDPDHDRPARLLERHSEHRRAETLTALAADPHTPHAAVGDVLHMLHPAEPAWIAEKAERGRAVADLVRGPRRLQRIENRLVLLQPSHPPLIRRSRRPRSIERGLRTLQLIRQEHQLHAGEVEVRLTQRSDVRLLRHVEGLVVQARVLAPLHRLQLAVQLFRIAGLSCPVTALRESWSAICR